MDIGLSCTVWAAGERAGHLDGIGIYSRALWQGLDEITRASDTRLKPYSFGKNLPDMACIGQGLSDICSAQWRTQISSCSTPLITISR